jgi:hypothetical protein
MAKTVAEIDGDSSGLVSSLDKAKTALGDLGTKGKKSIDDLDKAGKKLSDQLKSVADDADVAAGNLVSKLGGPGAIKAIAGVGLAFEGASRLAGAFLDSSEALFKSYGDEGQKVWDETEKSLFAVKGAFAEAVLGGGSMEDMGARLKGIFDGMKTAVDLLLLPIKALSTLVIALGDDLHETAGYVVEASDKLDQLASSTRLAGLTKTGEGIDGLRIKLMALRGETEELRQVELARDIAKAQSLKADILANELQSDAIASAAAVAGAQPEIAKKADEARLKYIRDLGEEKLSHADLAAARRVYNNEMLVQGQLVMAQQMKQREGLSEATKQQLAEVETTIAGFKEIAATKPVVTKPSTGGGGGGGDKDKPETPEEQIARLLAAAQAAVDAELAERDAIKALREKNDKDEQQLELDKMKRTIEINDAKYQAQMDSAQRAKEFEQKLEDEYIAAKHAAGELTEAEEAERDAARLQSVKDLAGEQMGIYMQNAGKQLAIGKLSAKAAADMARSQLGNVIIGQGDEAMAKAGIMAAALNPLAIPMAAAGLAAYAIGNAMMPTAKPTAGSTPATEKPADSGQAATNNYSFNMRVDSVFADGESVARQFAMMQESARQRGLLMQGA